MPTRLLSPEEAAEILSVEPSTVRKWLRKGTLKGFKLAGKLWRVSEEEVERFMKASEVERPD